MVQELINLLPPEPGTIGIIIAIIGSLIGAGIRLLGARYSRPIITLLTVLLGATVGMQAPTWFGWNISGAGPAVGAALVLGVTGYVLHGMWVGIGLGTVLCSWAAMACWIMFRNGAGWTWPRLEEGMTLGMYCSTAWQSLPADVTRILPYACITALITGLAMAIIWPRASLIIGWSLAGATLLAGMGVAAIEYGKPDLLINVPPQSWAQATFLAMLVTIGALVQWKLGPKPATAKKKSKEGSGD